MDKVDPHRLHKQIQAIKDAGIIYLLTEIECATGKHKARGVGKGFLQQHSFLHPLIRERYTAQQKQLFLRAGFGIIYNSPSFSNRNG